VAARVEVGRDETGAILLLALAYIILASVMITALTTWAINDLHNTTKFASARSTDYAASSAVEVAINSIRYTALVGTNQTLNASPPSYCWGSSPPSTLPTTDGANISVWCSTLEDLGSQSTRTVTFYACPNTVSSTSCAATPLLQAIVVFNDYPPGSSSPLTAQCTEYCGEGATLENWNWGTVAGSATGPIANSINVTSTPPARVALNGTPYTPVATDTSGDPVQITATPSGVCSVTSSTVSFGNTGGTCTIDFNDPGNINYLAAGQVQQTISVGLLTNVITVTSSPTSPTAGGATYTPVATATSADTVATTSATASVCTVTSNVVTFVTGGTCLIDFNDSGNANYSPAAQVQQSITVTAAAPSGADVQGVPSPQDGKPGNGDAINYIYNQVMSPSSLLSNFSGTSTPVYVQLSKSTGSSTSLKVCSTSNCSTVVNLGTVSLGDPTSGAAYISSSSTAYFNATMLMSTVSGESVVTVTLGTLASGTITALSPTLTSTTLVWTPSSSATNSPGGLACTTGVVTESTAPKANF
jgi:hypothetical protein